jgi:tetratricopeptide (TPR) repeat protein
MSSQSLDFNYIDALTNICDKLSERTATLFLGAGINANLKNADGEYFPLGQTLSDWLARDLLEAADLKLPLTETGEMARYKLGPEAVNKYIYDRFSTFSVGTAHLILAQLPWDVIYTTNYDLLVENAFHATSIKPIGKIKQIFSSDKDLSNLNETDIPYYKLHGSIDYANTQEGRLILTKEDYRFYQIHRMPLFKRLQRDLLNRTFLFIGYSFVDDNFRTILDECLEQLGTSHLPLSYAIKHNFSQVEEVYWREKYNIQLLQGDSSEFLNKLKETWIGQKRGIIPLEERHSLEYLNFDSETRFPKVVESYYKVTPSCCTGKSNFELFFKGAEPTWNDIKENTIPEREEFWNILDSIFPELINPTEPSSAYLITGSAGTGKTTLAYTLAYRLADEFDIPVLVHISGTPLEARLLAPLAQKDDTKRIVILIRNAAEKIKELEVFFNEVRQLKLPVTCLLEERKNQWAAASNSIKSKLSLAEFELGSLSNDEIDRILDSLEINDSLGKLTGTSREYQVEHFKALAHKELLVALRELTSGNSFDEIIRDEYKKIPKQIAREAYVYVATFGQLNMSIRYEVIVHLLGINYAQLSTEIFQPTEGILISGEHVGKSRFDIGFRLSTRHPVIASIIFDTAAPDDDAKIEILNKLLYYLDPGHREDRRLLEAIVKRKELVSTLESPQNRRAIYERLEKILPNDPFVYQHRSILERDLGNAEEAVFFARKAYNLNRTNPSISNTLGFALEFQSRTTRDSLRHQALISEASRFFDEGIKRLPNDPFGYLGKYYVMKQLFDRESVKESKTVLLADIVSLLDEAYEATDESDVIANVWAQQQKQLGNPSEAIEILTEALDKEPTNHRIRHRLVDYVSNVDVKKALEIAMQGAQLDATAWRIQRSVARLQQKTGAPLSSVRGHYEAAIRHNKGDINLAVEYGAYIFKCGLYNDSKAIFHLAAQSSVSIQKKRQIQQLWKDENRNNVRFSGKINEIKGAMGFIISVPENFEASFWRNKGNLINLREGQPVEFSIGFNAFGAQAIDIRAK